jgi:hypothetical protein
LTSGDITHICAPSGAADPYRFEMVGLWGRDDKITYTVAFTDELSYITLNFNLLLLLNNVDLTIQLGEVTVYTQNFTTLSNLNATSYLSTNATDYGYLQIDSLTSGNVRSVIQKISVDLAVAVRSI